MVGNEVTHPEPAGTELLSHATHSAILQHPTHLLFHNRRLVKLRSLRTQLVIRNRLPKQET